MEGYEELGFAREPRKQVRWRCRCARMRRDRQMWLLVRHVARSRRLGINLLLDDFRGAGPTFARQMAMYLAHVELGRPQKTVAFLFGREPSSVSHACARMEMLRDDPAVEAEIGGIERAFRTEAGRHAH